MRGLARLAIIATGTIGLITFFGSVWCALLVHQALADGAIENSTTTCLNARDRLAVEHGVDQRMADWWFVVSIREHLGDQWGSPVPSLAWQLRGMAITYGMALTTNPAERIERVRPILRLLRPCRTPSSN